MGECTWNTVWWKSVYALLRAPVPISISRFREPRKVICSTMCEIPCWSFNSSTEPTCIWRWASNRPGGDLFGTMMYSKPLARRPRTRSGLGSSGWLNASSISDGGAVWGCATAEVTVDGVLLSRPAEQAVITDRCARSVVLDAAHDADCEAGRLQHQ